MQIWLQRHKERKAAQGPTAKQHDLPEDPPLAITPARAPGAAEGQPKGHETRNKPSNNTQLHKIYAQKDDQIRQSRQTTKLKHILRTAWDNIAHEAAWDNIAHRITL